MPGPEQCLGHEQVDGRNRMDAVGDQLRRTGRVGGIGLTQCRYHRGVEVRQAEFLVGRQLLEEIAVAHQHLVVAALELRCARDIVIGRRLNQGHADARDLALHGLDDVLVAGREFVEDLLIEGTVTPVVHPQHDGEDGGIVGKNVAPDADIHGTTASAGNPVAAPPRMYEADVEMGEARDHVGLGEGGVETLIRDAVAEEDDPVAIVQREALLGRGSASNGCQGRHNPKQSLRFEHADSI